MPTTQKIEKVAEMTELFRTSGAFFVTDYLGLNVEDVTNLRKKLRQNGVKFMVAKNTLFKIAAQNAGAPNMDKHLKGPTAIAFVTKDAAVAAKMLDEQQKEKELPRIKAFVVDSHLYGASEIKRLADLPSREVLLSMVVGAVEAPLTSLVGSIDGFFHPLINSINALADKRKNEAA